MIPALLTRRSSRSNCSWASLTDPLDVLAPSHLGHQPDRLAGASLELLRGRFHPGRVAPGEQHRRAVVEQRLDDGAADPARPAGHEGDLPVQRASGAVRALMAAQTPGAAAASSIPAASSTAKPVSGAVDPLQQAGEHLAGPDLEEGAASLTRHAPDAIGPPDRRRDLADEERAARRPPAW